MDQMMNERIAGLGLSRRRFMQSAALGTAAFLARPGFGQEGGKPNSTFNGVHVGCITYSYRGEANTAEQTLKAILADGISDIELMDGPIMSFAGIPQPGRGRRGQAATPPPSDADKAKARDGQLAKVAELRKMYNDAGVSIHCHKVPFGQTDEDIEFNFAIAKALGCKAITTERNEQLAKRVAPFAEKHKIYVAFHNHDKNVPVIDKPDPILEVGPYIALNVDIGHYVAGTKGKSPIPVIEKYHDRIINLHLKDRTATGGNVEFGKGDTPIKEVLQLLKKEKWPIFADIELEYQIPKGSTAVAEVAKCVAYCKAALA